MPTRRIIWILVALVAFALTLGAQDQPKKEIKHVPIKPTSAASGSEMYSTYCAVCHGKDGKGAGPAAEALKVPPTDLTMLSKNNGGKYPSLKVSATIRGEATLPAHGSAEMPVWGRLFRSMSGGHDSEVQQRVANLNQYIESLQAK
ncbi:MAG: c-type cytochrome [Acidobacteriia bacterium]|nr:c-type cytochrome [Terriglobia bacterium]